MTQTSLTRVGSIGFYLSRGATRAERQLAAQALGSIVVRGQTGVKHALELRAAGWAGELRLDPADYERPHTKAHQGVLFGPTTWLQDQQGLAVTEFVSPGTYVPAGDTRALTAAIMTETAWLHSAGSGRLSLALHREWLHAPHLGGLVRALAAARAPLSLAFADENDPMRNVEAVSGVIHLLGSVGDVMITRADMLAYGALANGAAVTAFGTGTSVRHVVPPGSRAGGGRRGVPSVLVPSTLSFKQVDMLSRLPQNAQPRCLHSCCQGALLSRFDSMSPRTRDPHVHNLIAAAELANDLLSVAPTNRAGWFKQLCIDAATESARIAALGRQPFPVSDQVLAWATA